MKSRPAEGAGFESYEVPNHFFLLSFFPVFCVVVFFSIHIYVNNCYLIKCDKQKEKYRVFREKIVHLNLVPRVLSYPTPRLLTPSNLTSNPVTGRRENLGTRYINDNPRGMLGEHEKSL